MYSKVIVASFAMVLFVQGIASQCCGGTNNGGSCQKPCGVQTSSGGGFIVNSVSPINPTGLFVVSENTLDGCLAVQGQVPFLGAVALEGSLPSQGQSNVQYGCGDCNVGITEERTGGSSCGFGGIGGGLGGIGGGIGGFGLNGL